MPSQKTWLISSTGLFTSILPTTHRLSGKFSACLHAFSTPAGPGGAGARVRSRSDRSSSLIIHPALGSSTMTRGTVKLRGGLSCKIPPPLCPRDNITNHVRTQKCEVEFDNEPLYITPPLLKVGGHMPQWCTTCHGGDLILQSSFCILCFSIPERPFLSLHSELCIPGVPRFRTSIF